MDLVPTQNNSLINFCLGRNFRDILTGNIIMHRFFDVHSVPKDSKSEFKLDQSFKNEYRFLFSAFNLSFHLQLLSFA